MARTKLVSHTSEVADFQRNVDSAPDYTTDWQKTGSKEKMLQIYDSFHTSCKSIIEKADQPKIWKLLDMDKMPTFVHKRLAVLGDAAHPL